MALGSVLWADQRAHTHSQVVATERNLNYIARFNQSAMPTDTQYDSKSAAFGVSGPFNLRSGIFWCTLVTQLLNNGAKRISAKEKANRTKKTEKKPSNRARVNPSKKFFDKCIRTCLGCAPLDLPCRHSLHVECPLQFGTLDYVVFMCLSVAHKKSTKVDNTKKFLSLWVRPEWMARQLPGQSMLP